MTTPTQPPTSAPSHADLSRAETPDIKGEPEAVLLDPKSFARLAPGIKSELLRLAQAGELNCAEALEHVFTQLFGAERPRREFLRFLVFAAPLARRIAIELADADDPLGDTDISVADLKLWMWWLDTMDPLCARMIDLHYFAGLSTEETGVALQYPHDGVLRDLRFAKAWLKAKVV